MVKMTYKIKLKCKECNGKAKIYYHTIPLCSECYQSLKNGNKLQNVKKKS